MKIKLFWVEKFFNLLDSGLKDSLVIAEFINFCYEEEKKVNERWEK